MAAIELEEGVDGPPDMPALYAHLAAQLPPYAQPRFLRVLGPADGGIELTRSFKPKKGTLQAEGIDPSRAGDVYVRDARAKTFVRLDAALYDQIMRGTRQLD